MESGDVLGLFAKRPVTGEVKTRLAAAATPGWAARAAECFLLDLVDRLTNIQARRVLVFSPASAESYFAGVVGDLFALAAQVEGNLGQRMAAFFTDQFQRGATKVVLVGTDSPTLPLDLVQRAFRELERAELVLGPATDGGYYLIGASQRVPPVFERIAWSTPHVLLQTVAQLTDSSFRLALLPPWYDVDTLDDWWMLQGHLRALRRAGLDPGVPRTEQLAEEPVPSPQN
jgi:rSAM/selenodomain-associated transferase 1